MPLPADLLQAIITKPNDDEPRRHAADWCRANGLMTRADFIEGQLELALRANSPDDDAYDLAFKLKDLVEEHGAQWLGFDELDGLIDGYYHNSGFIELAKLSANGFLQHIDTIYARTPIRHLDLTDVTGVAETLFQAPQFKQIVSLSMARCNLKNEHLELFASSPNFENLQWLSLDLNDIGMEGTERLAASKLFPKLQYVGFFGNQVDPTDELLDDQGIVVSRYMSDVGLEIESRCGEIPWFHPNAELVNDLPPNRFSLLP